MNTQMTSSGKRLRIAVFLSYAYSFAQVVINLIYVPLLLRGLGSEEYGLYQLIGSLAAYLSILSAMFQGGTTRYYCKYYAEGDTAGMESTLASAKYIFHRVCIAACLIGVALVFIVRFVYSDVMSTEQINESSAMLVVVVINLIVIINNSINVSVINAHERFFFLKASQLASIIIQPCLVIVGIFFLPYALVVSFVQLFVNALCAVAQRVYARQILNARSEMHFDYRFLRKKLFVFAGGMLLALIADQVFWRTNQLVIGYYFGMSYLAVYGIATQIQMVYMSLGTAISNVFLPRISLLMHGEDDFFSVSDLFVKTGRIVLYPLSIVLFGFAIFGESFISLWVGPSYVDAYVIVLVLLVPFTVDLLQNTGLSILQAVNKYSFRAKVYCAMAIANIVLVLMITPYWGAVGAAACSAFCMFVANGVVMNLYYGLSIGLEIKSFWANVIRVLLPLFLYSAVWYLVVTLLEIHFINWPSLIITGGFFILGYVVFAWGFCMNEYEKSKIKEIVLRKRSK